MREHINYCSNCGSKVTFGPVPDDDRPRHHCEDCSTILYQNPNMVVGCIPIWQDKILMCKRAIEPRYGLWTLPAGFLEFGENAEDGAVRETIEEAHAEVEIKRLFSVYSLPKVGQVYLMFLAELQNLNFSAGKESLEVKLFRQKEIPWDEMAFSAVKFTLEKFCEHQFDSRPEVFLGALQPAT